MGSRIQSALARIKADFQQHPGVWIGLLIAALTLFIIWRAYKHGQSSSTSTTDPNSILPQPPTDAGGGGGGGGGGDSSGGNPPQPPIPIIDTGGGGPPQPPIEGPTGGEYNAKGQRPVDTSGGNAGATAGSWQYPSNQASQADLTRALPTASQPEPDPYGALSTLSHARPIQHVPAQHLITSLPAHHVHPAIHMPPPPQRVVKARWGLHRR